MFRCNVTGDIVEPAVEFPKAPRGSSQPLITKP